MQNDPTYQIRNAFYTALNGNTVYDNVTYEIKLYESLQKSDEYIKVGYPEVIETDETKDKYIYDGQITVEVVNRNFAQSHSNEQAMVGYVDDINSYIVNQALSMTGFTFSIAPYVVSYRTEETLVENKTSEIKKIITYQFKIQQDA